MRDAVCDGVGVRVRVGVAVGLAVRVSDGVRLGVAVHVADFGRPHNALMRAAARLVQLADGGESTAANLNGELPALIAAAGFGAVRETEHWMTPFGTLTFVRATRAD